MKSNTNGARRAFPTFQMKILTNERGGISIHMKYYRNADKS